MLSLHRGRLITQPPLQRGIIGLRASLHRDGLGLVMLSLNSLAPHSPSCSTCILFLWLPRYPNPSHFFSQAQGNVLGVIRTCKTIGIRNSTWIQQRLNLQKQGFPILTKHKQRSQTDKNSETTLDFCCLQKALPGHQGGARCTPLSALIRQSFCPI